jgi:hypothetical protein
MTVLLTTKRKYKMGCPPATKFQENQAISKLVSECEIRDRCMQPSIRILMRNNKIVEITDRTPGKQAKHIHNVGVPMTEGWG